MFTGRDGLVRIAHMAPLNEAVPPRFYGGTLAIVKSSREPHALT
jgi:hypothetical protein